MKYSEIGSNFWLAPETKFVVEELDNEDFGLPEGDMAFTSTGRGAILLVIAHMKQQRKVALLPSFTCSSVILPFVENGYQVDYYDIEKDLTISKERFLEKAEKMQPSVILVQNYYGFDTLTPMNEVFGNLQKQGVVIIEDVTHSLYSGIPRLTADYYVTSLRKWFGIPEGGMALSQKGPFQAKPTDSDSELERAKLDALYGKYRYIMEGIGEKPEVLGKCRDAETMLENQGGIHGLGDCSKAILANVDVAALQKQRRENYGFLVEKVNGLQSINAVFPTMPDAVVPLFLPVFTVAESDRKLLQAYLSARSVYAPILWPSFDGEKGLSLENASPTVKWVYKHILCIPVDQRYGLEDMAHIADVLTEFDNQ